MDILVTIVIGVLRMFLPALFEARKPTAEDGEQVGSVEARLRAQIKKEWL
jgi:hypothetical protein